MCIPLVNIMHPPDSEGRPGGQDGEDWLKISPAGSRSRSGRPASRYSPLRSPRAGGPQPSAVRQSGWETVQVVGAPIPRSGHQRRSSKPIAASKSPP
jgi:hypothetical protein